MKTYLSPTGNRYTSDIGTNDPMVEAREKIAQLRKEFKEMFLKLEWYSFWYNIEDYRKSWIGEMRLDVEIILEGLNTNLDKYHDRGK